MEPLLGKREKKSSRKAEKNESSDVGVIEDGNYVRHKVMVGKQCLEKEETARMDQDGGKKKKKHKAKKDAKGANIEKNGTYNSKVFGMCSKDCIPDAMQNVERKRRKREKNKNENNVCFQVNEDQQRPQTKSIVEIKGDKEVDRETKNKKVAGEDKDGYTENKGRKRDGEEIETCSENCKLNAMENVERKKRKREKKQRKGDGTGKQDTLTEAFLDAKTDDDSTSDKILNGKRSEKIVEKFKSGEHVDLAEKVERTKKKKMRKIANQNSYLSTVQQEDSIDTEGNVQSTMMNSYDVVHKNEMNNKKKKMKRKENPRDGSKQDSVDVNLTINEGDNEVEDGSKGKKKGKLVENYMNNPKPKNSTKKVRFSGHVEVFPPLEDANAEKVIGEGEKLVQGKRFTREEDEIVQGAVYRYIEEHDLGEEGLNMVLNCSKHPRVRHCWKEIGTAIPYRPYTAVYYRAQVLFRRSEHRKWTEEEYEMILNHQKEFGNQWKVLADELGKHRWHVKDTWRRIRLPNMKKGQWSQDEYQGLFDLVNTDLQQRVFQEKRSKHGMLRDNICWTAISDKLSTRGQAACGIKWYRQLMSPMVAEGIWADIDDYRLLSVLFGLDPSCIEDVDWDNLLDDRSGDACQKRWNQMVLHIGHHGNKSFAEQVDALAQRYCPYLLEAREAWDSKPRVP